VKRALLGIALLVLLVLSPAASAEGSATLRAIGSGLAIEVDAATHDAILARLGATADWMPDPTWAPTHEILLVTEGATAQFYYVDAATCRCDGAVLNSAQNQSLMDVTLNSWLRPSVERLRGLESEVAFARTLQIIAGVALASLVGALFFIGMREERRPQVFR